MNRILLKKSSVKNRKPDPTELMLGEVAINTEDGLIFFRNKFGDIHEFRSTINGYIGIFREIVINAILLTWLGISCIILVTVFRYST